VVEDLALAGGGSLGHFRGPLFGAALHFVRRDILDMLCEAPLVAEGIGKFAVAIAPKLIRERHVHASASGNRTVEGGVNVLEIDEERARIHGARRWRTRHAWKLVTDQKYGGADSSFSVT